MPLTSPKELQAFLRSLGVHPKKALSQNFLVDGNIIRKIVQEAAISSGDVVLEIGPGPGALTEALCAAGARVIAVEKDRVYAQALKRFESVEVHEGDFLHFDLSILPKNTKVVANLPYQLTAPILTRLAPGNFSTLTLMVQEEVARRIAAQPKTKDYGSLTVFLAFYAAARYAFKVSRRCFYPSPKVDSAVITLTLREPPPVDPEAFFAFVRQTFQQRRKMIKSTLKNPQIGEILEKIGEDPQSRPEDLSLDSFLSIYSSLFN